MLDQLFGVIASLILAMRHFQVPAALLAYLHEKLAPRFARKNEELFTHIMKGVRDFAQWLSPLNLQLHNAFMNRRSVEAPHRFIEAPHAFSFRRRGDISSQKLENVEPGDNDDVLCLVKAYMHSTDLLQLPLLVLPACRRHRVTSSVPEIIVPLNPLPSKSIDSYLGLADVCEKPAYNLLEAAAALRALVIDRTYSVPPLTWLSEPGARQVPNPGGNAYFEHLPAVSWQLKVKDKRRSA